MGLLEDRLRIGRLLDEHAMVAWCWTVPREEAGETNVPEEMRLGEPDADGWVAWRMLPSTLELSEVVELEREFQGAFPPLVRAYLLARFHLFDQVYSRRYNQQIRLPTLPSHAPLQPLRSLIRAWQPLVEAGFVPLAQWGVDWGPMGFDRLALPANGEGPLVWFDQERLAEIGPQGCRDRTQLLPLVQPLYNSCEAFFLDVFGSAPRLVDPESSSRER